MTWQLQAVLIVVVVASLSMLLAIGVPAAAETNCKAQCQQKQKRPPEARKTRYAVKSIRTIHIPTHIPDSHRRALMRMQPEFTRWAFTAYQPIWIFENEYEG